MREAEAIKHPGGTDKPRPLGGLEGVQSGLEVDLDHVRQHVGIELRAGHRRSGQDLACPVGQPGQPPAHDVAHPRGERRAGVAVPAERGDHLADEERVALGDVAHAAGERRPPPGMREDRGDVGLGERAELDPGDVRPPRQTGHHLAEQGGAAGLGVAVSRKHEQPHRGVDAQQMAEQKQREVVGPVHVVEHEQHRRRRAGGLQQRRGGLQRAQPLDLGRGGRRLDDAGQARVERRQQPHEIARARAELDPQLVDRTGGGVRAQRLGERLRGRGEAVVAAPVKHHPATLARVPGDLRRQARLADARFAAHQHAATPPRYGVGPRRPQLGEFRLAPREGGAVVDDEGRGERDHDGALRRPRDRPGAHRLHQAPQRQLARLLEPRVGSRPGEQAHGIGDHDRPAAAAAHSRCASITGVPKGSSPSHATSPAAMPMRSSSATGPRRAWRSTARCISTAQATAAPAPSKVARRPSPSALTPAPPCAASTSRSRRSCSRCSASASSSPNRARIRAEPARSATRIVAVARRRSTSAGASSAAGAPRSRVGILGEDRLLQALELGSGTQAELGVERPHRIAVGVQRLPLSPGAIQRQHQLPVQPLAQRLARH